MHLFIHYRASRLLVLSTLSALLTACGSVGVGVGVPLGPLSVGVGLGSGGPSIGVGAGVGPVGVGVGVRSDGQVSGHAGVGVSAPVGPASVGVGVGHSTVLHDPQAAPVSSPEPSSPPAPRQWRDAQGRTVPECQTLGGCGAR